MSLNDHPKAYGTAALTLAFFAGVLVTLGFKDLYPELEARYQRSRRHKSSSSSFLTGPVYLEDRENSPEKTPNVDPTSLALFTRAHGIVDGIEGTIGNTPLIRIRSTILAKAEFLNGAGNSPKDRVALSMILAAEEQGLLVPGRGDTIYEGTVGSTGISLAALARARGYKAHICMPDDVAREKSDLLRHLGAEVERVPVAPITDPQHYVNLARARAKAHSADPNTPSKPPAPRSGRKPAAASSTPSSRAPAPAGPCPAWPSTSRKSAAWPTSCAWCSPIRRVAGCTTRCGTG
jgi:cysteine synthase A